MIYYRAQVRLLDPFNATKYVDRLQICNPKLRIAFLSSLEKVEAASKIYLLRQLLPRYQVRPLDHMKSVSNDLAAIFPRAQGLSPSAFLKEVPLEKLYMVRLALHEWNHLIRALKHCTDILRMLIIAIPEDTVDVLDDRLNITETMLIYLRNTQVVDQNDVALIFHWFEYLRHLMCLRWAEAERNGSFLMATYLWKLFVEQLMIHG